MNEPISLQQQALRAIRIVHGIMLGSVFMYPFMADLLHNTISAVSSPDAAILIALSVLAVLEALVALYFRKQLSLAAIERLRLQPDDQLALKRWRAGGILVSVLCQSIAMYGFVLRFLGFSFPQSLPFYLLAAILLLIWWPRFE